MQTLVSPRPPIIVVFLAYNDDEKLFTSDVLEEQLQLRLMLSAPVVYVFTYYMMGHPILPGATALRHLRDPIASLINALWGCLSLGNSAEVDERYTIQLTLSPDAQVLKDILYPPLVLRSSNNCICQYCAHQLPASSKAMWHHPMEQIAKKKKDIGKALVLVMDKLLVELQPIDAAAMKAWDRA
ncbi:hypothetical protein CIHG_06242 [Coccidioides immitis H538.4]|uniref:Uncharacterized protein n=3 Tax=Coccidioides immitis TaxID=5501 RepID=A0A0J8QS06_COCIT|nr:hypothetical protein CIRG_09518 [Coccidioides immitis RMSCC 2394]KMU75286.1 hypothetical protein CISG_04705 [Coccidioides immitis RMSCC 3703]KMU88442.1 hypothetical protein CIHG_06242 [Coccidioides immitis H538.4]